MKRRKFLERGTIGIGGLIVGSLFPFSSQTLAHTNIGKRISPMEQPQTQLPERIIIVGTETTGIDPQNGHRLLQLACVEVINNQIVSKKFWSLYPEIDIPIEATRIHGISNDSVADCPTFQEIADEFLDFIRDDKLVIHHASFDMSFINNELVELCGYQAIDSSRIIDTLKIARTKYPSEPASMDALCDRFDIAVKNLSYGDALDYTELLVEVYFNLMS